MNTETQFLDPQNQSATSAGQALQTNGDQTTTPGNGHLQFPVSHRRNGKVARLPKAARDKINTMLLDGVPYQEIIRQLGPDGEGLTECNISNWKDGGHQDWLRTLQLTEALQARHELAQDFVANSAQANGAPQALLQIIAANLCQLLAETDPSGIRESLLSDADKFTRFVNCMVRLAEGGIKCELYKFQVQDRAAAEAKKKQPAEKGGISEESLRLAEEKLRLL